MDPTLQLWQVIGTWLTGVGTVGAVITSLWFSWHQNRVKLRVVVGHRVLATPGSSDWPEYCTIRVTNIGIRPAKIVNVSWHVGRRWTLRGRRNKRNFIQTFGHAMSANVPTILQEGEEAAFMVPLYSDSGDGWLEGFARDTIADDPPKILKSLRATVHTSVGQRFTTKPERNLLAKIRESYETQTHERTAEGGRAT